MTEKPKPHTHTAFILKREGKRLKFGRWLECGVGRLDKDGAVSVFLDRLPVGGFSGHVFLAKIGTPPPVVEPERGARDSGDHDGDQGDSEG